MRKVTNEKVEGKPMELIEIGQIVNTHGIRGEVKLNPWTDDIVICLNWRSFISGREKRCMCSRAGYIKIV